jgi:intergrase/recombinase
LPRREGEVQIHAGTNDAQLLREGLSHRLKKLRLSQHTSKQIVKALKRFFCSLQQKFKAKKQYRAWQFFLSGEDEEG